MPFSSGSGPVGCSINLIVASVFWLLENGRRPARSTTISAILLTTGLFTGSQVKAQSQSKSRAADLPSSAAAQQSASSSADGANEEIVVTARRGDALIKPETELSEDNIARYGARSIGDLLRRLAPLIGDTDEGPILLVNGKRIDGGSGITGFPPEALKRLGILPPEAGPLYGYPTSRRVVNLTLKPHFVSWSGSAGVGAPTSGGRDSEQLSAGRVVIDGAAYWNAQLRLSRESALLETTDRQLANRRLYRSLLPAARTMSFSAGITRPVGALSGTVNVNASRNDSSQGLGLPGALIYVPETEPIPPLQGAQPMRSGQRSTSAGLSTLLSGMIDGWQGNFALSYSRVWLESDLDHGFSGSMAGLDGPSLDSPLLDEWTMSRIDRTRSTNDSLSAQLNLQKSHFRMPSGPVSTNLSVNLGDNRSTSEVVNGLSGTRTDVRVRVRQLNAGLTISIPLASRAKAFVPLLGELSVNFSENVTIASGSGLQSQFTAGLSWSPIQLLSFSGSLSHARLVPTPTLLKAARMETVTRLYDYARQDLVNAIYVSGGNPALTDGIQQSLSLRASLRPFGDQRLTLTSSYKRRDAVGGYTSFPALTPAIENSFPERISRDASGALLSIDARPINIDRERNEQFITGVAVLISKDASPPHAGRPKGPVGRPVQITVSLDHSWQLTDELRVLPGSAVIDQLSEGGAQPRHEIDFQLLASVEGMGASVNGEWKNAINANDAATPDGSNDFRYAPMTKFNVGFYAEPLRSRSAGERRPLLANLRMSIDVQNLFNARQRVSRGNGRGPALQGRNGLDPLGRTVQFSVDTRW